MNEDFLQFKDKLQQRLEILETSIIELQTPGLIQSSTAERWREHLLQVQGAFQDKLLRVAVVGAVKSGKSTLINSLLGRDLLKRGAGILTAFITRIQTDGQPGGWIELKPWHQILEEINSTLRLMPICQENALIEELLDIRNPVDRERLRSLVDRMQSEWQQVKGTVDPGFLLLRSYLSAFPTMSANMGESINRLIFDEQSIACHQRYVGKEAEAVYVRDMELHCPMPWLGNGIEIADCQGIDSINPIHMELLQQYLLKSHFIVYVVNSRTGLREADLKLLKFIRTLRMFPQTFFILNADFDVHPNGEDLESILERVRTELEWVVPSPQVFTFSALYHLVDALGGTIGEREARRFAMWREDPSLAQYTENGFASFRKHIGNRIVNQRTRVLLGSGLSRLSMVAGSVLDTASAQKQFMSQDLETFTKSVERLKQRQETLSGTLDMLNNSLLGLRSTLMIEIDTAVAGALDPAAGSIAKDTLNMVEYHSIKPADLLELSDTRQLFRRLHHVYLDFRQTLARYIVERVNLRMIEFAQEQEAILQSRMAHSSRDLWSLFESAVQDYRRALSDKETDVGNAFETGNCESSITGRTATPPSFSAFMDKGKVGRSILLMKFSLGKVTQFLLDVKCRVGKPNGAPEPKEKDPSREIINLIKSETKAELMRAFEEYRKEFQFGYLSQHLDSEIQRLKDKFQDRADMTQLDFSSLMDQREKEGETRKIALETLTRTAMIAQAMVEELDGMRYAVSPEWLQEAKQATQGEEEP